MPRVKHSVRTRQRKKKVLKAAKGQYGARSKRYRLAKESVVRALSFATRDRKVKKRTYRGLWIARINAACRQLGVSYSAFINALAKNKVMLDRKILAELAVNDEKAFAQLTAMVKK